MHRRLFGALGVVAALTLTVGSCKDDPFSDLDGDAAAIVTDFSYLQMPLGGSIAVTASVVDGRATPLAVPITFTPCSAAVTAAVDTSYHPVPATSARAIVTALTPAPSCVEVRGGGLVDTITVAVLPVAFTTFSPAIPLVGQPFSLFGNALLGFDVATADVDFGGGIHGEIIRRVGDTLIVRVPQPDAAQPASVTVEGVAVKYVPGLVVSLSAGPFTVTNPFGVHDGPGNASATIVIPADGDSLVFYDGFTTDGVDYFWPFSIASTDTLTFTLSWAGAADLDMASCNGVFTGCTGGFAGATVSNPETFTGIFPAGNYHLFIEQFDTHDEPAHLFKVTIRNP